MQSILPIKSKSAWPIEYYYYIYASAGIVLTLITPICYRVNKLRLEIAEDTLAYDLEY